MGARGLCLVLVCGLALAGCAPDSALARLPILRPVLVSLYVAESRAHAADFDNTAAVEAVNRALALAPEDPSLLLERARRYLLAYRWDEARADIERAIALAPANAAAHYTLGLLFASAPEGIGARAQAIAAFSQAVALAPEGTQADSARRYIAQLEAQLAALEAP